MRSLSTIAKNETANTVIYSCRSLTYSMDKFVIVGGFLCFAADVFAIASLATPEWVVMEFAGKFIGIKLSSFLGRIS